MPIQSLLVSCSIVNVRLFVDDDPSSSLPPLLMLCLALVTHTGTPWVFECPLTLDLMTDPVIAADGITYVLTYSSKDLFVIYW